MANFLIIFLVVYVAYAQAFFMAFSMDVPDFRTLGMSFTSLGRILLGDFDYDALVEWLSSKQTDPSTNLPLSAEQLCPNRTVRSMIEDFIAKGPNFLTMK